MASSKVAVALDTISEVSLNSCDTCHDHGNLFLLVYRGAPPANRDELIARIRLV